MSKTYLILCFCLMATHMAAQNLVPNSSFEVIDSLPCSFITGDTGAPWLEDYIQDWSSPTGGTSDIHSILLPDSCYANPSRLHIQPRTDNNMAGIYTALADGNYREYLEVKLKQPLVANKSYYAEMYVLRNPEHTIATNNLGMYFSKDNIETSKKFREVLDFRPQVLEKEIIQGSKEWQKVSGCFIADTNAEYLLIGNFFDTSATDTVFLSITGDLSAYYFIDDVSVREEPSPPDQILGHDTTLCAGETLLLNAYVEGATYQWDDFSTQSTLLAATDGIFWVDITMGDCTYRDSITLRYEPAISLGKDTLLCEGESLLLDATHPDGVYQWSDGSTASTLEVTAPGTYWVTIPSAHCLITDTIQVSFEECPGMIPNVFTPGNDTINETFYISNIANRQWQLSVFNRWGKEVYFSDNYQNDWTGDGLPAGVYYYSLYSPALQRRYKGWVQLLRQHTFVTEQNK